MTFLEQLRADHGKKLMIGGHRGHLSEIRENTIENYKQVLGSGISHIEIDIQLTKDNVAVIYHDYELSDRTSLTGRIRDYTLAELKAAFEIDTLDESVAWCKKNQQAVAFELKSRALDMYDFMPEIARQMEPRTPIGLIVPFIPADPVKLMQEMDAIIYLVYLDSLSPEIVNSLHEAGYYVDGSVVNTPERMKAAIELGVDLIESDHPLEMLQVYEEMTR